MVAYAISVFVLVLASSWEHLELGAVLQMYVGVLFLGGVVLVPALPLGVLAGRFYADRVQYAQAPEPSADREGSRERVGG